MSSFEVKVRKISEVYHHPNADRLDIVKVDDYNCIALRDEYAVDDLIVYIPEAAIVPDWLLEKIGLTDRLAGKKKNRVKAIKLRGILSQGLIYPITGEKSNFGDACTHAVENETDIVGVKLGDDVTEFLGITKYEPVIPTSMSGEVFNAFGMTLKFDIENIKKFPNKIEDGEEVSFTEKLHGTWCCFGYHPDNDFPIVTSKGLSDKGLAFKFNESNEARNLYVRMFNSIETDDAGLNLLELYVAVIGFKSWDQYETENNLPFYILGEIFGAGVQDLTYGNLPTQFRVFDIYVGEPGQGHYLNDTRVEEIVNDMNAWSDDIRVELSYVPVLYRGPFSKEALAEYTDGTETASGNEAHMREGVVVRVANERRDDEIGRVILKSVSEAYLLRKGNATEYT